MHSPSPRLHRAASAALALCLALALASPAPAQELKTVQVVPGIWTLQGPGGNIGVSVGEDGVFLIDSMFAPTTAQIRKAVGALTDKPLRFLVNTHWHGDHTGGNENLGQGGAIIVAHENTRKRLAAGGMVKAFNMKAPPAPKAALPVVTFTGDLAFHYNGDSIRVFHVAGAHTDGDAIIHFTRADVIHTGDVFFNGMYPFIDPDSGGRITGVVAAVDRVLSIAGEKTRIIPGHGPVAGVAELRAYRDMLAAVAAKIQKLLDEGKSADQIVAAKPTAEHDATWGKGFLKPDVWVRIVCDGLTRKQD